MGQIVQVKLTTNPSKSGSLWKIDFEQLHCLLGVVDWQDEFHEAKDVDDLLKFLSASCIFLYQILRV